MSEPIKIVDKLTLRQEALRMAIATGTDYPISQAQKFEAYLLGDVTLPAYENPNKHINEMLAKMQESFKPKPFDLWFSADSDVKPPLNKQVLVMCADSKYPQFGEYLGEDYWEVEEADVIKCSKDGEVTVIAWMPIHEYKGASK